LFGATWTNVTEDLKNIAGVLMHKDNWGLVDGVQTHCSSEMVPIFEDYPVLRPAYFDFELHYSGEAVADYMRVNMWFPFMVTTVYAMCILQGSVLMKSRKPFDLRVPLTLWNFFLAIFSWCGVFRTAPRMLHNIFTFGFKYTVCKPAFQSFGVGPSGFWATMFVWSKFPELIDTVFIVLRKKPLLFLHWYHHVTVLLFCWHGYSHRSGSGMYFIAMNFTVHAVMYTYYGVKALESVLTKTAPPKRAAKDATPDEKADAKAEMKEWRENVKVQLWPKIIPPQIITIMQLSQMVVGTAVCIAAIYFKYGVSTLDPEYADTADKKCGVDDTNLVAATLMYSSYFILFLNFFINRYCTTSKKQKKICGHTSAKDLCGMNPNAQPEGPDYAMMAATESKPTTD
jgi:hypothetical protein